MSKATKVFDVFEKNGSKALEITRSRSYNPESRKILRSWGINEASEMVGKTRQAIVDAEKSGKVPKARTHKETGRRYYTLKDINILRRHFKTLPEMPQNNNAVVLSVANFKGGVSKTTTAVHFAQYMALKGYKTLFIDCDSQASGSQYFGLIPDTEVEDEKTLLPFLLGKSKTLTSSINKTHWDGLDLIPANLSLYSAEFELPIKHIENQTNKFKFYEVLSHGIDEIKHLYDIIILDCPPSMGMISINAIYSSDAILIPLPASMLDFSSTVQFFSMMRDVLSKIPEKDFSFIRILITKHEKTDNSIEISETIRALYSDFVCLTAILQSEAIKKADAEMKTIYEIDKYKGSKKTFERAKFSFDEANSEIETLIKKTWNARGSR